MSSNTTPTADAPTETTTELAAEFQQLRDRIDRLETDLERKDERIEQLEADRDHLQERTSELEDRVDKLESEATRLESLAKAALKKANANKARIAELQSRELEKGAHLRVETIDEHAVDVVDGRLERITKADGQAYYRLPESVDPLERGGNVSLAYGDLLPIQQLARMDKEMRRSAANALPTRLAAKLWQARTDSSVGDNPWESGCKDIDEYVKASDLKHWIRRQETGISESYAKKLVSRVIDAMLDLSKNRLAVRRRQERKNGLEYTERRLVIPVDAELPGEGGPNGEHPETDDVHR
ncbi:hypothetical protein SAMN05444422_111109 [Halobiforma haloterrestris]|uniref:Uncharacterized protein n=1 Tax=Natronobacterium haloterrestre TaxID=148448 RepID=A0A1I1KHI8_NATHA|nr:hypothetical protein [Halobiforma haloterrestris]SFC59752.1 hypothetical protein SAMN05444422_111109 [Halobiforma haloterrestris]